LLRTEKDSLLLVSVIYQCVVYVWKLEGNFKIFFISVIFPVLLDA